MGFVVWWTSLCWKLQLKENFEKLRRRTTVFTSTDIQPRTSFFFVTSLPWMHGLRTDFMIWFFFGTSNRMPIFLANLVDLYFTVFAGNTGRLDWQTSFYLQIFSSGVISNFLKFLGTALQYLWNSPREQLQLERSHLVEDHQLQTERVKKPHSDFCLRWNSEKDFKEKLQSSRSKILTKDLTFEELRLLYEKQHCEELLATSDSIGDLVWGDQQKVELQDEPSDVFNFVCGQFTSIFQREESWWKLTGEFRTAEVFWYVSDLRTLEDDELKLHFVFVHERRLTFHVHLCHFAVQSLQIHFRYFAQMFVSLQLWTFEWNFIERRFQAQWFETSNAAWILHLWAQLWRKTSTPFSTFLHWRKLQVYVQANFICQDLQLQNSFQVFLHHFFWFSLSTHKTFDVLLNFTASTITTSGINFLSLWIENFRNSCSKFLNFS